MTRDEALAALKAQEDDLRRRGVAHAGLFGSLARGEETPGSDIDVLIRFSSDAAVTLWDYANLKRHVARLLRQRGRKIDVIDLDGMNAHARLGAERDAVYAF